MNSPMKIKTNDPQWVLRGKLKPGETTDMIIFTIPLGYFELVCIVNIPLQDQDEAPVYVKFKIARKTEHNYNMGTAPPFQQGGGKPRYERSERSVFSDSDSQDQQSDSDS